MAGDGDLARVADRDGLDTPGAIDENADAAVQRVAGFGELTGQIVGDDVVDGDAAAVQALGAVPVGVGETKKIAVEFRNRALPL